MREFRKTAIAVAVSTAFLLSACAGGGGGSGASPPGTTPPGTTPPVTTPPAPNPYLRTEVPYYTPVLQAVVDPLVNVIDNGYKWAVADTFAADITGTGGHDLVVAGRMTQWTPKEEWGENRISLLAWQDNRLVDKTSQWFRPGENIILGTEPSVHFADFFKTGRQDMFLSTGTDMQHYGPTYFYRNTGSSFERQTLTTANIWSHGSAVGDLNGDGYKDIAIVDYGTNSTVAFNNRVDGFNVYTQAQNIVNGYRNPSLPGGSSIAIGEFLQNGQGQVVVSDVLGVSGSNPTKMYSWSINAQNELNFTEIATLPTPRFELPKWQNHGFAPGSHNVRTIAYDFNDDRVPDVLIFSRPGLGTVDNKWSEIQFLKNNGTGNFTDVTDTTLVGYNHRTHVSYNPRFIDLNGDGREDILVTGADFTGANNSSQFLLKSSDGKYVAAHQNILTDFATQANTIQNTENVGNTVNILKAPNGKLYLVSAISFMNNGDRQLGVYMSELGSQSTTTAQTAVNLILQKWPYMSMPQVNEMLARTSATYFGGRVLDLEALMNPIGSLSLPTGQGLQPVTGWISGVNLDNGSAVVMDSMGRGFNINLQPMNVVRMNAFQINMAHNDQHTLTSHAEYLVNGPVVNVEGLRIGGQSRQSFANGSSGQGADIVTQQYTNYTVGIPKIWSRGGLSFGTQYTALNQNPWLSMGGAWGQVTNSNILDNVVTYRHASGFSAQASFMHVTTNIVPGLITNVSTMTGGWAETGYRYTNHKTIGDVGVYAGVKPVVFSGEVSARMPTAVDTNGNVVYTSKKMAIQNQTTPYLRAMYSKSLDRNTQYRLSGMVLSTGQYRVMHELRWWLN
jgi:hypothetical protein